MTRLHHALNHLSAPRGFVNIKKYIFLPLIFTLASTLYAAVNDVEWYISNPAGMALERTIQLRALREKNALAVREVSPENVPREIRKYYSPPWHITCNILYEDGKRVKTQWVFRDAAQTALFAAAISDDGSGFIEWYDDHGFLVEEQRLDADGAGYFISYSYKDGFLLKAEGHYVSALPAQADDEADDSGVEDLLPEEAGDMIRGILPPDGYAEAEELLLSEDVPAEITDIYGKVEPPAPPVRSPAEMARNPDGPAPIPEFFVARTGRESGPVWTDSYRYTRTKNLRSIERVFHDKDKQIEVIRFPRFVENGENDINFVEVPAQYVSLFLSDIANSAPAKIDYTFDNKRRIVTATYRDGEDAVIGELKNTWMNDHLTLATWMADGDERQVVYVYDDNGNRIKEENFRNGVLERDVVFEGERETETLYKDGRAILRIKWIDGRKISEEPVNSSRRPLGGGRRN
jgi:hypothetical protein